jgi:hypothetical protein
MERTAVEIGNVLCVRALACSRYHLLTVVSSSSLEDEVGITSLPHPRLWHHP